MGARSRTTSATIVLAIVLVAVPGGMPVAPAAPVSADRPTLTKSGWRAVLNFYRATAGLAPVKKNGDWNRGAFLHSRYMAENDLVTHFEKPSMPYYTSEGDAAGRNGNVILSRSSAGVPGNRGLIEKWMAAPFHAAGMIDPALRRTGFGKYKTTKKGITYQGATLDVLRGRSGSRGSNVVVWPGEGMQVPLRTYSGNEWPDPLTACKGYRKEAEVGLPILALFPNDVRVKDSSLRGPGGGEVELCTFDRYSYTSPDREEQRHARDVLASRNTVVLVPRAPLRDLSSYSASITTTGGRTVRWSFSIGEVEPPVDPRIDGAVVSRAFQDRTSFGVAWNATDTQSGVATFDVRWRRAPVDGKLGSFETWQRQTDQRQASFKAEPGYTYCFSARATDRAGNRSVWSPERCTTMPLRAGQLKATTIWAPVIGDHYDGTARMSLLEGAQLATEKKVRAKRLALIATRMPGGGVVEVLFKGERIGRIDLDYSTIAYRQQFEFKPFKKVRRGKVVVRVLTPDRRVVIEGLGVARA